MSTQYPRCFGPLGNFNGDYHIVIDPNIQSIVHAPRRCPIALRDEVKAILDKMETLKVIQKVHRPTDWVSSLVYSRKANGTIRICLDPKDLNRAIKRPHYTTRTLDEIKHHLDGATVFSKLDARSGYWSVHLDEPSSFLTTFNSPFGRYRFLRLPFGLNSSQDVFQERMDQILESCPGTISIADDIGVFGKTIEEHNRNLRTLMDKALRHELVFNESKCFINTPSLSFYGLLFDKEGVHPYPSRIRNIKAIQAPTTPKALQEFLGIATYMSPFTKNLAHHTTPLRELLKKDAEFHWNPSLDKIFNETKERICSQTTLVYYNPHKQSILQVDASGYGLGATLLQEGRPVAFASKSLSPAETRYANIEREMLAIVFGCERFHNYIYGTKFIIHSDHKPLDMIVRKNLHSAPTCLQRMLIRVQQYDFDLEYKPGSEMLLADVLSRQPIHDDKHINLDIQITPIQFSRRLLTKLQAETSEDPDLQFLRRTIQDRWPKDNGHIDRRIREYWPYRDELTVYEELISNL